jgi:CheY-like chemotaxis protein
MSRKPKILCVDDKIENVRIRAMLLEQFGCEAVIASDHNSALRACTENSIDLALLDYHLARGENGEDLARDLRVMYPKLPLIMLTGDPELPGSAAETVDAVLVKGQCNPRVLLDIIEQLLLNATLAARPPMSVSRLENPKQEMRKRGKSR